MELTIETLAEFEAFLATLRKAGVTHYQTPELSLVLGAQVDPARVGLDDDVTPVSPIDYTPTFTRMPGL